MPGPAAPLTTTLPSGQTLRGSFNLDDLASAANQYLGGAISLGFSLRSAPAVQIVPVGGPATTGCAGSESSPSAAPGYLCIYELSTGNAPRLDFCNSASNCDTIADPFGTELFVHSSGAGQFGVDGTWAVTAP